MHARVQIAEMILRGLQGYVAVGALIAFLFMLILPRVESTAAGASLGARILILPGAMLLWPYVLVQCVRRLRARSRNDSTAHAE